MAEVLERDNLDEIKPFEVQQLNAEKDEAYERGKIDFNFFAGLLIPSVMVYDFPDFYVGIFNLLKGRSKKQLGRILRFALGLPRGHAKTTFIKILICWFIVYDKITFVAVICASDPLAEALISDINDMLSSENATLIYGHWERQLIIDNKSEKQALYHNKHIIISASGAGSSIRGINRKHRRPDFIFFDDAQTKECDDSEAERTKFKKWFVATIKIIAPYGNRLIVYVGNMYSDECLLYKLKENKSWISLITGAIKENGDPLWPELHSLDELMESYFHDEELGEADVWFAEVMNDPVSRAISLLTEMLPTMPHDEESMIPDGVFITIDPAGFKSSADDNVIAVHYVFDGKGIIRELDIGIKDPEQLIISALKLAIDHGASVIGIEEVGYQQTLLFWIRKHMVEMNLTGIEVVPLKPSGRAKEARIRLFIQELYAQNYFLSENVRAAFIWQAMKYKIGRPKNRDDILDTCAYGLDMRTEYWQLITNLRTAGRFHQMPAVISNNTPF